MKKTTTAVVAVLAAVVLGSASLATIEIQKDYKAGGNEANCTTCHISKMPKKGAARLNAFGKKVKAAKGEDGKIDWTKIPPPDAKS